MSFLHLEPGEVSAGLRGARWNYDPPDICGQQLLGAETVDDVLFRRILVGERVTFAQYLVQFVAVRQVGVAGAWCTLDARVPDVLEAMGFGQPPSQPWRKVVRHGDE